VELKITGVIVMNLGIFDENFKKFWISGAIRIKSDKNNRSIKGWDLIKEFYGYNLELKI
jgi:hypothetical protein